MYKSFYGSAAFQQIMRSHFLFFLLKNKTLKMVGIQWVLMVVFILVSLILTNAEHLQWSVCGLHTLCTFCWVPCNLLSLISFLHIPPFLLFWNKSLLHILGTMYIEDMVFTSLFPTFFTPFKSVFWRQSLILTSLAYCVFLFHIFNQFDSDTFLCFFCINPIYKITDLYICKYSFCPLLSSLCCRLQWHLY